MPGIETAIAAIAAISIGTTTVGAVVTTAIIGAIVSTGLSFAASALFGRGKKPAFGNLGRTGLDIVDSKIGTVEYLPVIYGTHRTGGIVVYAETLTGHLYQVTTLCEGDIDGFDSVLIDNVDSGDAKFTAALYTEYLATGTSNQVVPAGFLAGTGANGKQPPGWTSEHQLLSTAYVANIFKFDRDIYPGQPVVTAVLRGRNILDFRINATAYSTNPALVIYDYLTNTRYGSGIPATEIDTSGSFTMAANYYDQLVDYGNGNQKRFEMNARLDTSKRRIDLLDELTKACSSALVFSGGLWKLIPFKVEATHSYSFSEDNIVGGIEVQRTGKRFKKNRVNVQFLNPNKNWQPDLAIVESASFLADDDNEDLVLEMELDHVTDYYQANYTGQLALAQSRMDTKISFTAPHEAIRIEMMDVVSVTHAHYGWSARLFRVTGISLNPDATVMISAEAYDEDVYDITLAPAEDLGATSTLENPFVISPPGTPTISQTFTNSTAGDIQNNAVLSWAQPNSGYVDHYQVEYKLAADPDYIVTPEIQDTTTTIRDLNTGVYDFRVKAINTVGSGSEYASRQAEIVDITDVPADITGFDIINVSGGVGGMVTLKWDENSDVFRGGRYVLKHSDLTSGADWNDVVNFTQGVSHKEKSITVPAIDGTYMIKGENIAGIQSANFASVVLDLPDSGNWVLIQDVDEESAFAGTHNNTVVVSGVLRLDGAELFDDAAGNFDDAAGNFDDGVGAGNETAGDYTFGTVVDLGAVYRDVRVKKTATANFTDSLNNFDTRSGLFDAAPGLFDGGLVNTSTVTYQYRTTRDDPGASPTWSSYLQLGAVEEITTRGLHGKVSIAVDQSYQNVEFSALGLEVYLKKRTEDGTVTGVSSGGSAVSYGNAFYAAPVVAIFITNAQTGDYVGITSASRTGFTVTVYDSGDNATNDRNIGWIASGHGEQVA